MVDCIFCKIRDKHIPKEFTYEDEFMMVFPDIHPIKPVHLLIMPKKHITDFSMLNPKDGKLMDHLVSVIQKMVENHVLQDKGYRLVVNGGGAQIVNHLHIHLTGPWGNAAAL